MRRCFLISTFSVKLPHQNHTQVPCFFEARLLINISDSRAIHLSFSKYSNNPRTASRRSAKKDIWRARNIINEMCLNERIFEELIRNLSSLIIRAYRVPYGEILDCVLLYTNVKSYGYLLSRRVHNTRIYA